MTKVAQEAQSIKVQYRTSPLPVDADEGGPRLVLTKSVAASIDRLLPKRVGHEYHENVLYVAGKINPSERVGSSIIQPRAETSWGHYRTDRASHAEVLDTLGELGLVVVAQVHCHPGATVYHSDADDDLAFVRAEGHWSFVVPYYGLRGMLPVDQCGFHQFRRGRFAVLSKAAAQRRIVIVSDADVSTDKQVG